MQNQDDLKAEIERLRFENLQLKKERSPVKEISFKIGEKGGLSVYGLGRFPVTLYKEQWLRLLERSEDIKSYIKENDQKLKAREV